MRIVARFLFAAVWLVNGVYCKVLGMVPRHEAIVARILGPEHAHFLTLAIGWAEVGLAAWILSGFAPRHAAFLQIVLVLTMNLIEWFLAPDLLLWGRANLLFAGAFSALVYLFRPVD